MTCTVFKTERERVCVACMGASWPIYGTSQDKPRALMTRGRVRRRETLVSGDALYDSCGWIIMEGRQRGMVHGVGKSDGVCFLCVYFGRNIKNIL